MVTRLVIVSDTHVPQRARRLPDQLWRAIDDADVVLHAGDWTGLALVDEVERRAARLVAVRGNNDGPEFDERLPLVARAVIDGVRFAVVHETGARDGREARMAVEYPNVDVLVFGHSHIPWHTTAPGGLRLLNPGSPTDKRREPHGSYLSAVADDGALREITLHPITPYPR